MSNADHQAALHSHADKDLAHRSRAAALVYLTLFVIITAFSPYVEDHFQTVTLAGTALVLVAAWRSYLVLKFDKLYSRAPGKWRRSFVAGTLMLAGIWGLFCMHALNQYGLEWTAMLTLLSTAGISAGAVTTLSIHRHLINAYLALLLLPPIAASVVLQAKGAPAVTLMFLTYLTFMLVVAKRINREYWEALHNTLLLSQRARELEASNQELESYSYSIAHDLRAPLRSVISFSQVLLEDARDKLSATEKDDLNRVVAAGKYMAELIDDILELSRITRTRLQNREVDLSELAVRYTRELEQQNPKRRIECRIQPGLRVVGDQRLLDIALRNLIDNAWKFTSHQPEAEIDVGATTQDGETVYHVRDNGAGFDMRYADKLFKPFNRLHKADEFSGTGIGLATVQRIIQRHGGRVWAHAEPDKGASFYFVLGV